ncbi:hypothetical protein OBBRIDRAFT_331111, partial [Obba rivulosa]
MEGANITDDVLLVEDPLDIPPTQPVEQPIQLTPVEQALAGAIHAIQGVAANQQDMQDSLRGLISALRPTASSATAAPSWAQSLGSGGNPPTPRFKDPRTFDGSAAQVEPFLTEMENALYLQRRSITTDYEKSLYLSTWLKDGSPKSWFYAVQKTNPGLL